MCHTFLLQVNAVITAWLCVACGVMSQPDEQYHCYGMH